MAEADFNRAQPDPDYTFSSLEEAKEQKPDSFAIITDRHKFYCVPAIEVDAFEGYHRVE
ncbi:hypothetical protein [Jeotgalibacillus soli]|uniref:Uncharacterized protein n=1 Tax=Jeotgalibacillus soli TaxID=889306 RepID=A0A0C2VKY9_9BACL|nr:hypothetical protein [Jeotgalibacillus soli]KIL45111.1 hypothetical protein KP78_26550 [Jeotgalibacillus soli]